MFNRLADLLNRRQKAPDIAGLQDNAVRSIAADVVDLQDGEWEDRDWVYLAVNHEIAPDDGQRTTSQAKVLARRPSGELEALGFRLSMASKAALLALRDAMTRDGQSAWTILDLTVERSGRYNFEFSSAPPPRLNGDLLHAPLSDLLERYLEKQSGR